MNRIALMLTSAVLLASSAVEAQSVDIEANDGSAALTRKVRIGWRELNLPLALRNDQLDLTNHGLTNDIAKLEGRGDDVKLAPVTTYRIQQDKWALEISRIFAYVFTGKDVALQRKLADYEQRFNGALDKCHPKEEPETLDEAVGNCDEFREIQSGVSQYQIIVSRAYSVFDEPSARAMVSVGRRLLATDTQRLMADKGRALSAKIKNELVMMDEQLANTAKMLWLSEIQQADVVKFNATHPSHQMASSDDVVEMMKSMHEKMLAIADAQRHELLHGR